MDKVIRDGKVAVLYSPGFGAGWFTWNSSHPELLFHPKLVELVEANKHAQITEDMVQDVVLKDKDDPYVYLGGRYDLTIKWVPQGARFEVTEYDGSERVVIIDEQTYMVA